MKKLLSILIVVFSVFAFNVYASDIDIINVEVNDKTHYVEEINNPVIDGSEINYNLRFRDYQQYIIYKVSLRNNTSNDYNYELLLNESNIIYELLEDDGVITSKSDKDVLLKINYKDQIDDNLYDNDAYNIKDKIQLKMVGPGADGIVEQVKGVIEDLKENPKTGRFFNYGLILVLIFAGSLIFIKVKKRSSFKYYSLLLLLLPIIVYAETTKTIIIDMNVDINVVKPTVAIFRDGYSMNSFIRAVSNNNVEYVHRSYELNSSSTNVKSDDSNYDIYMWWNEDDKTVYYYSDAIRVLYNETNYNFYYNLPCLRGIDDIKTDVMKYASSMFSHSSRGLDYVSIDISNWDTRNAVYFDNLFYQFGEDTKEIEINADNFEFYNIKSLNAVFSQVAVSQTAYVSNTDKITINANNWKIHNEMDNYNPIMNLFYSYWQYAKEMYVNARNWEFDEDVDAYQAFYGVGAQTTDVLSLDVSGWKIPKVEVLNQTFHFVAEGNRNNSTLDAVLNVSGWETPSLKNMDSIFMQSGEYVHSYKILGLEDWDVSNVTNMYYAFAYVGMYSAEVDISGISEWDVSNVTNTVYMLEYVGEYSNSVYLDLSKWDTSSMVDTSQMLVGFGAYSQDAYLDISGWDLSNSATTSIADSIGERAKKIVFKANEIVLPEGNSGIFSSAGHYADDFYFEIKNLQFHSNNPMFTFIGEEAKKVVLDVSGLDIRDINKVVFDDFGAKAESLKLIMNNMKINNNTDINKILKDFGGLNVDLDIDMSNLDLTNRTSLSNMFDSCFGKQHKLKLDLSGWDTSNITNMSNMFNRAFGEQYYYVSYLNYSPQYHYYEGDLEPTLEISGIEDWDVSNVTNMSNMFTSSFGRFNEVNLDLSGWDTSNLTDTSYMFKWFGQYSQKLTLNLTGWNIDSISQKTDMFNGFANQSTQVELIGYNL